MSARRTGRSFVELACAALLLAGLAACGGGKPKSTSTLPVGSLQVNPATGLQFVVESNVGGNASLLKIRAVYWGRLVDVYARDTTNNNTDTLLFQDFMVGEDVATDGIDFELTRHPVTGKENLVILHAFGTPSFALAFNSLELGLQPFLDKGLAVTELPPFTALPRNGAMVVVVDDLLDDGGNPQDGQYPGSVNTDTVKIDIGYPPSTLFEPRIFPDPNHGDIVDNKFHSTRVIIDMTVTQAEAAVSGVPVNGVGLPQAINTAQPNVALRVPTRESGSAQQFDLLTNLAGHTLSFTGNGSTDPFSPTLDVVRAFRSGGATSVTGDAFNGFLRDDELPRVVGAQAVTVTNVLPFGTEYLVDIQFATLTCAVRPLKGSILELGSVVAEVTQDGGSPSAGAVSSVHMRVLSGSAASFGPGVGELRMAWDLTLGAVPECFLTLTPTPAQAPDARVSNQVSVLVRFNEPIDPDSMRAFETFTLSYGTSIPTNPIRRQVAGQIATSTDLTEFTFVPSIPLKHTVGVADIYKVDLATGTAGITDLAGNPLQLALTTAGGTAPDFTIEPTLATIDSGSVGVRFSSTDEDANGSPEFRGELIYDLAHGRVRPRSLTRFSAIVDNSEPVVAGMAGGLAATRVPLTPYGCRLQTVWRYHDMGFHLLDDATHNLDIEGLNWAPNGGGLQIDNFNAFSMQLAHSKFLPDEILDMMGNIAFPGSGLSDAFSANLLDPVTDPQTTVHAGGQGYTVQPLDVFTANSGTRMTPWPMNQGQPLANYIYWTWRDTGKTAVGGPSGGGADYGSVFAVDPTAATVYLPDQVPTIGLPVLMEFRAYPSTLATGGNRLLGNFASAQALPENTPFFTAYSAGGITAGGVISTINPDGEDTAHGTFPPGGNGNLPRNQFVYFGQADFVIRVSRAHSIWFDSGAANSFGLTTIEPPISTFKPGTQLILAYRGATGIAGPIGRPWENATNMDPYGNPSPLLAGGSTWTPTFTNGAASGTWFPDISAISGSQFFQVRVSMISNAESGVSPELSSLGFSFYH